MGWVPLGAIVVTNCWLRLWSIFGNMMLLHLAFSAKDEKINLHRGSLYCQVYCQVYIVVFKCVISGLKIVCFQVNVGSFIGK